MHKAHLTHWALQHNQRTAKSSAIAWAHSDMWSDADYFSNAVQKMHYLKVPTFPFQIVSPTIAQIRDPMESYDPKVKPKKPLRVLLMSGHGTPDGMVLELQGPDVSVGTPTAGTMRLVVPTQNYYDQVGGVGYAWGKQQFCLILETIRKAPKQALPLDNLDMVVVCGCSMAGGGLGQEFLTLGAKCVVRVGAPLQPEPNVNIFLGGSGFNGAFNPDCPGFLWYLGNMTVFQAEDRAKRETVKFLAAHPYQNNSQVFDVDTAGTDVTVHL
jgi:hypothetical protein